MQGSYELHELSADEVPTIEPLLAMLAAHHRAVAEERGVAYQPTPTAELIAEYAEDVLSGKGRVVVIESDGKAAGCCVIGMVGREGYIDELAVMPAYRGQGLGARLMRWALDAFRDGGATELELMVVEGNDDAVRFYERFGFRTATRVMRASFD